MLSRKERTRGEDFRCNWRLVGCRVIGVANLDHVFDVIEMIFKNFSVSENLRNRALKWRIRKKLGLVSIKKPCDSCRRFILRDVRLNTYDFIKKIRGYYSGSYDEHEVQKVTPVVRNELRSADEEYKTGIEISTEIERSTISKVLRGRTCYLMVVCYDSLVKDWSKTKGVCWNL